VSDGDYMEVECKVERKRERSRHIASSGLLPLRMGRKLAEWTAFGWPLWGERSTRPSRTTWSGPCQTATTWRWSVKWKEREKGQRAWHRPDCSHSGLGERLHGAPHLGSLCEEKGQQDHQEQSRGDRVRRRLDWEIETEPIKAEKKLKTLRVTVSDGLWEDCIEMVFKTVKNNLVWTVLGGSRMEGRLPEWTVLDGLWEESNKKVNETDKIEPINAAKKWKTPRVHRIGRPLGEVQLKQKGHWDHQVLSSVNRVGQGLDGEWKDHQGGEEYIKHINIYF
jgi:hypothetical protein